MNGLLEANGTFSRGVGVGWVRRWFSVGLCFPTHVARSWGSFEEKGADGRAFGANYLDDRRRGWKRNDGPGSFRAYVQPGQAQISRQETAELGLDPSPDPSSPCGFVETTLGLRHRISIRSCLE